MANPIEAGDAVFNLLSTMASLKTAQNPDEVLVSLAQGMAAAASIATSPRPKGVSIALHLEKPCHVAHALN